MSYNAFGVSPASVYRIAGFCSYYCSGQRPFSIVWVDGFCLRVGVRGFGSVYHNRFHNHG